MTTDQVKTYVDQQVQSLADAKIRPVIQAINGELETQRHNNERIAEITKANTASNERITKLQTELGAAQQAVADLQAKLSTATEGAVTQA